MYNLLICDDENYILDSLKNNINWKKYGIEVKGTAINGQIALNKFKMEHYDIVLVDIKMPILTGTQLAREIRRIDKKVQIIFITSLGEFEYAQIAINVSACGYILKPFREEEVITAIKNALERLGDSTNSQEDDEQLTSQNNYIVQKVDQYIEENIGKKLSLKLISDNFGYSTNYLGQLYKKYTGVFINDQIAKIRMEKAIELLKIPQNHIGSVAEALGYSDIAYFIKQFREYYGVTPKVFRDSNL